MSKFHNIIEDMRKEGQSFETIATSLANALNEIQKREENESRSQKFVTELRSKINLDNPTFAGAAAIATLTAMQKYDWSLNTYKDYFKATAASLEATADLTSIPNGEYHCKGSGSDLEKIERFLRGLT